VPWEALAGEDLQDLEYMAVQAKEKKAGQMVRKEVK